MRAGGTRMSVTMTGSNFARAFEKFKVRAAYAYQRALVRFAVELNKRILAKTPVWEGDTLRNWRWSIDRPSLVHTDPAEMPDDPGHTAGAPLGSEARRPANTVLQMGEFAEFANRLAMRPKPANIYLTNVADSALGVEYGLLPTPERSRSPRGVLRLSVIETLAAMGAV